MTVEWLLLLLVLVLVAANALFVAAEFALVTVDRPTITRLAESGDKRASSVRSALRTLSTQLSGAQLGITVTSLVVGFIAEPSIAALLLGPLASTGLDPDAAAPIAFTAAFLIATATQMVFGELVPKNWAIAEPVRVGRAVAGAQRGFTWASGPLLAVLNGTANRIVRMLGIEPQEELASARSAQELSALAERSAREGSLDAEAARRLSHSVELAERTAADAMTPRPRVRFVDATDPVDVVLELAARTGHARFPVLGEGVDDVVGVVHFKHALAVPKAERGTRTLGQIARPVSAVPSAMPLDVVLEELRGGLQLAVVVDEYGGTDGIITLEDLVEEIVGEIQDEQDRPLGRFRQVGASSWSLSGLLRPDEAGELTGVELPEGRDADTLGGLVTEVLERFPEVDDDVVLDARDTRHPDDLGIPAAVTARLKVTRVDGRRVDRLLLTVDDDGPVGRPGPPPESRPAADDAGADDAGDASRPAPGGTDV
ncbi:hemolysin family protein [Cellulomonas carbonis]|uniref:Membrane protein n=1 Tax=Cellulomonas carbonis T26 TaxID=947969 RepID=A0A0A0BT29_9CELL|nr:hemolysin family protein [Cellulomonas carbonis]KGM10827.1 membrane protein [Cellulomonas carbonis T26]GGC16067.1 membrane protein [Cellulomonas carbonis]